MISLGVHHFGKRTVWSLVYFLNYGYYDIQPSLKFIASPFRIFGMHWHGKNDILPECYRYVDQEELITIKVIYGLA